MKKSSTWIDAYGSYTMQTDRTDCFFFKIYSANEESYTADVFI